MRHSHIYIISVLLGCLSFLEGCGKRGEAYNILEQVDSALLAGEDSVAFEILMGVEDSVAGRMNEAEGALYAVLVNQVLDRMDYELDDSLAQAAVEYYGNNDARDDYHEGLAYYYMGHILMRKNDISAIGWYSEAKECFKKSGDLRYEFLSIYYWAELKEEFVNIDNCILLYKEALDLAERIDNTWYKSRVLVCLASCYSYKENIDSTFHYVDKAQRIELTNISKSHLYCALGRISLVQGLYEKAISYCDSSISISQSGIREQQIIRAEALIETHRYEEATDICMSFNSDDLALMAIKAELLYRIYSTTNQKDSAIYYSKTQIDLRDSLYLKLIADNAKCNISNYVSRDSNSKYSVLYIAILLFIVCLIVTLKITHKNKRYARAEYTKAFTSINCKVKVVMSEELEDLKCKERVYVIIEESLPSAIQTIMNKCPYLDEKDAVSLIMYWANLSSSMIGRVVFLSRGGAYKKLQNAIRRIEEEFGTKNMDVIIENIFS